MPNDIICQTCNKPMEALNPNRHTSGVLYDCTTTDCTEPEQIYKTNKGEKNGN